ncbi:MAG: hypothetical protein KDD67_15260 [Ignavibacteriae bacterium]|nr:hypothetical protein [Ignavibacteriota bacterium]
MRFCLKFRENVDALVEHDNRNPNFLAVGGEKWGKNDGEEWGMENVGRIGS